MAIKKTEILSLADFNQAVVKLRLNVTEVAKELGIPRTYLSEFRNGDRVLRPEQLAKIRDYFETKGIEFDDEKKPTTPDAAPGIASLNPQLSVGLKVEHYFPLSNNIADEVIREAMFIMDENDARLAVLLQTKLERESVLFGEGDLTEETKAALQETFALLAGNYITFRMLRGWRALNVQPSTEKPETVRDMILQTFMQPLVDAGLIVADPQPAETEEEAS
jgi:transcriptional regulator with XRE-family HTH domain